MTHVVTLISDSRRPALDDALLHRACAVLPDSSSHWLAPRIAADLMFTSRDADASILLTRLRDTLGGAPVDVVMQPITGRRKRLFLADMDSTMIGQECIDELADFVGLKTHVAAITERAMRGEIAFEPALRERVALLKGLPLSVIGEVIARRITLTPGARELVHTMRANGAYTCLVSGGFTLFTGPVAAMIGFDENRGNVLLADGDVLAGTVQEPILGSAAKRDSLKELCRIKQIDTVDTLAVGDGANDVPMLQAAGTGVAYHAKPVTAAAAAARIDHGDLTALLYLQGYRREDFVVA